MASSSKIRKVEGGQDIEDKAFGYIQSVSPMKTSMAGTEYFNAKLQEQDRITDVVGYKDKMRTAFLQMEKNRTPVKLTNVKRVVSFRHSGEFDIKLAFDTEVLPADLNFTYEKYVVPTKLAQQTSILQIKDIPESEKVSITAKVIKQLESVMQTLKGGKRMLRTTFIVADSSSSIDLTLWGPAEQLIVGGTYTFHDLTVKFYEKKKVTTNPDTTFKRVNDIKTVNTETIFKPRQETIEVYGVKIETVNKCCFCSSVLTINQNLSSIKCIKCAKRQLTECVIKATKCEITAKNKDSTTTTYSIPSDVLCDFTGPKMPNDDIEILLLKSKKLCVTFTSENSKTISLIQKADN